MVARAAGAAGPVLLACRHWDPRGLARRRPSRRAGAWRSVPLLPWRVQCPGRVCAALAAGSAGLGPVPGVVSFLFPPSRPVLTALCVPGRPVWVFLFLARWYAIPCGLCVPRAWAGCPSGFPRVSLVYVCARALAASAPPPLPGLVWRAHLAWSRCWALVGPFHAVCAPPRVLPRSRVPFDLLWGGGGRSRFPLPGLGLRAPRGVGAGVGTRHQPQSARSCELPLRAVGAARECPGGGASCLGVGRPGSGALPPPTTRRFGRAAGAHYQLAVGARGAGVGTRHQPQSARSCELALRCGGGMRAHGGGTSCLGVGRPGSGALPAPTTGPFGLAAGAHYPLAVGAGAAGVETRHQPQSARSSELALRAVGAARGRPGGAPLAWVWGVWGRTLSHPRPLVLLGVQPGPTTHWLWVRGVRAWGPVTSPGARAPASWLCALWGRHEGARVGRLLPGCGASGVGRSPTPDHSSFRACGRGPLPTGCGCGGAGVGTRHEPQSARSCELALRVVGAA